MKNRKSQVIGQVFIYILALVLISFVLIFGYNSIKSINEKTQEVSLINLKQEVTSAVEVIVSDYGSVKIRDFEIPSKYKAVCFVSSFPEYPTVSATGYTLLENSVNKGAEKNFFLILENKQIEQPFDIGDITIAGNEDYLCLKPVNNVIKVRLEGKGDHAEISKAEI